MLGDDSTKHCHDTPFRLLLLIKLSDPLVKV